MLSGTAFGAHRVAGTRAGSFQAGFTKLCGACVEVPTEPPPGGGASDPPPPPPHAESPAVRTRAVNNRRHVGAANIISLLGVERRNGIRDRSGDDAESQGC